MLKIHALYASLAALDPSLHVTYFVANVWMVPDYYKATTMRLLVSHQLTKQECMRAGRLTYYLIILINHDFAVKKPTPL